MLVNQSILIGNPICSFVKVRLFLCRGEKKKKKKKKIVSTRNCFTTEVNVNTRVTLELWEADYFGDDFVATISGSATEADGFKWAVPYDLSAILAAGGDSESGSDFFFKLSEAAMKSNSATSVQFKLSSMAAFLSVDGPRARSFATGSSVDVDVLSGKLPSREIQCNLKRPPISWPLPVRDYGQIVKYRTTAATGVQKKAVKFGLSSELGTADNYYIECHTSDSAQPSVTHSQQQASWFRIEQVKLTVTMTSPTSSTKPKANSALSVTWSTDGAGLMPNDKFLVRLFRVNAKSNIYQQLRGDAEVWSSTTANVLEPLVTALKFSLPIPVEAGPTSWLSTFNPLDGTTNSFYVRLTLKSNSDFNVESQRFTIDTADKGCGIDHPASNESIVFGDDVTFQFTCKGYSASANTGRFALLRADGSANPMLTTLDNAARPLTSGRIVFRVPDTFVQGWVYRVRITEDGDNPQNSHIFLGERGGNQCRTTNKVATCAGTPVLAATYENENQINSITLTWAGPDCNSAAAAITIATVWQKGPTGSQTTTTTSARLVDNTPVQQKLLGSACPDCIDVAFTFVEYPNLRKTLSFDLSLMLPTHKTATLKLGLVQFADPNGAVPAMGQTNCAGNNNGPVTTTVPPVIITDPPTQPGMTTTMVVVGGPTTAGEIIDTIASAAAVIDAATAMMASVTLMAMMMVM
jgi:hypothetical protein